MSILDQILGAEMANEYTDSQLSEYSSREGQETERLDDNIYGWVEDAYCSWENGNVYTIKIYSVTGFIPVEQSWKKIITYVGANGDLAGICFYDSSKTYIYGKSHDKTNEEIVGLEYEIPQGTAYIRFTTKKNVQRSTYAKVIKSTKSISKRLSTLEKTASKANARYYGYVMEKVLCIGDSLTSGAYYLGDVMGQSIEQNYPHYLRRMLNCEVTNAGYSGYSASDWYNAHVEKYSYENFDAFVVWFGTNYGCTAMPTDAEIDAFTPSGSDSAETANQALYLIRIIQTIKNANQSCHIILCNVFASKSDKENNNAVVSQIANKYGCQLIDMSDIDSENYPELHGDISNPHFSKVGNIYVANRLVDEISEYVAADPVRGEFGITFTS